MSPAMVFVVRPNNCVANSFVGIQKLFKPPRKRPDSCL